MSQSIVSNCNAYKFVPILFTERDMRMFTILEKMRAEQDNQATMLQSHGVMMQHILKLLGGGPNESTLPEGIEFPILNVNDLLSLDSKLGDKATEKLVVSSSPKAIPK